jgi:hypothetical protein
MGYIPVLKIDRDRIKAREKVFRRYLNSKKVEIRNREIESLPGVRFALEAGKEPPLPKIPSI